MYSKRFLTNEDETSAPSLSFATRARSTVSFSQDQPTTAPGMSGGYRYANEFRRDSVKRHSHLCPRSADGCSSSSALPYSRRCPSNYPARKRKIAFNYILKSPEMAKVRAGDDISGSPNSPSRTLPPSYTIQTRRSNVLNVLSPSPSPPRPPALLPSPL